MKTIVTILLALCAFGSIKAQNSAINYLNKTYPYGLLPNNIGNNDIRDAYIAWKSAFVETNCSNGSARIKFDQPAFTVSEGIAYGMLLSAYANDKELFDGLWLYYKTNSNNNGVMNWKIQGCNTVDGQNGATDAEIDVAIALIIAGNRFGNNGASNYHSDAKQLIAAIKQHEVESNTYVLKPGDAWGGSHNTNPSYFAPGYFKVYGSFTNDQGFWNNVANKCYDILNANLRVNNAVDCLVSDWCKADGSYSDIVDWAHEAGQTFYYDAARTPWRIATDYAWYGDSKAADYTTKCRNFINSKGGIGQIKAGYKQNGTVIGNYQDPVFTGSFASALLASNSQNEINTAYSTLKNQPSTSYFAATLRVLYMYTISGNLYSPLDDTTNPPPTSNIVHMRKRNAPNFAIDGNNGGADGQNVYLYSSNTSNPNQQWEEIDRGNGYYSYQKVGTKYCLDGNRGGSEGQSVYLLTCKTNSQNQQWKKVSTGGGSYRLEKRNAPNYAIDGNDGGANGQDLYLGTIGSNDQNQQWVFSTPNSTRSTEPLVAESLKEQENDADISPNPVFDKLTIGLHNIPNGKFLIIDNSGLSVMTGTIDNDTDIIDVSQLQPGIYTLQVTDGQHIQTHKIIKH